MTAKASSPVGALADWLEAEGLAVAGGSGVIADVDRVRALLVGAAFERRAMSYSEVLGLLGLRFTRPRMRALCRTLDAIDADRRATGRAELAVLVVRESDGLPGQGWWASVAETRRYRGAWTGVEAAAFVRTLQLQAFDDVISGPA